LQKPHATTIPGVCLYEAGLTDIGCRRLTNEDAGGYFESMRSPGTFMFIVADGVAGRAAGDVASNLAVRAAGEFFVQGDCQDLRQAVATTMQAANLAVYREAQNDPVREGMATVCTLAIIRAPAVAIGHVGDCRAYLSRDQRIVQLTDDHTLACDHARRNEVLPPGKQHLGNVLTRWLGKAPTVEMDVVDGITIDDQESVVLCSDGLYKVVRDEEILAAVSMHLPETACKRLVNLARERGGPDNIAIRVARLDRDQH
jgi:serine/threonine protein phosphatase PrpC